MQSVHGQKRAHSFAGTNEPDLPSCKRSCRPSTGAVEEQHELVDNRDDAHDAGQPVAPHSGAQDANDMLASPSHICTVGRQSEDGVSVDLGAVPADHPLPEQSGAQKAISSSEEGNDNVSVDLGAVPASSPLLDQTGSQHDVSASRSVGSTLAFESVERHERIKHRFRLIDDLEYAVDARGQMTPDQQAIWDIVFNKVAQARVSPGSNRNWSPNAEPLLRVLQGLELGV
ncbi:hypothetical protein F4780DRAFT_797089 [Xylariomycetidae sp. FL0641]|nr:hypothetical protein F4780DRAFT_797089 [Xylariomycetidae sp. FL0641]